MSWVIILFVLALIVSPVMWLKPSPRQKRVAGLRDAVIKAGIEVKLETPPLHPAPKAMPAYRWRYPQERPGPTFVLVRDSEAGTSLKPCHAGWRWRTEPLRPLPEAAQERLFHLLERLPQDALVLESNEHALTLWWYESQGPERFLSYQDAFLGLRDGLAGRPDRPRARHQG
ncbi:preprotein translocase subunit YajC [Halomonas sp. 328]|uniref:preprotein translocase subunit YajC n=1 Tax=Halomonas sp. 328 TaxID=2776704 RepID=UPI0018A76408|nr:preprotein translocase subunit YajC [Halomonas sp. 328]MBF8223677.1 preprotein translocase subunit YajC [Halomonas sp. 328]